MRRRCDEPNSAVRCGLAAERMTRELRNALPNSVRVSGNCLEFIPADGRIELSESAGVDREYRLRRGTADQSTLVGARLRYFRTIQATCTRRVIPGVVSPPATFSAPDANNVGSCHVGDGAPISGGIAEASILSSLHGPVSYCVDQSRLWRYQRYGYRATQPTAATLATVCRGADLLIVDLSPSIVPFTVSNARPLTAMPESR